MGEDDVLHSCVEELEWLFSQRTATYLFVLRMFVHVEAWRASHLAHYHSVLVLFSSIGLESCRRSLLHTDSTSFLLWKE
jgi:hypothetical protein